MQRYIRLASFALLAILIIALAINTLLAGVFVHSLTDPGCRRQVSFLEGIPAPQELSLHTQDGLVLRAWYYPPQNTAVILALGGAGGSLGEALPPVSFLINQGYGVLQIDGRNCARPSAPATLGGKELLEVAAALEFLRNRPEVQRIGAIGFSMGGVTAVRAAARYPEIAAVVDDGGYFNLGKDFVEPTQPKPLYRWLFLYTIAGLFWLHTGANPWELSPIDDLPRISPRPVLLIYGDSELEPGRVQAQFDAAQEPKALWVVPNSSHGHNHANDPQTYERKVLDFFDQYLLGN